MSNPEPRRSSRRRAEETNQSLTPDMLYEIVIDFLRRWGLPVVTLGILVGVLLGFIVYTQIPVTYRAVAEVRITNPKESWTEQFKTTQMNVISSLAVLNAALDLPEAKALELVQESQDPVSVLRSRLELETNPQSEIVDIAMKGTDPREIYVLVNAVLDGYLKESGSLISDGLKHQEQVFLREIKDHDDSIATLKRLMLDRALEVKHNDPNTVRNALEDKVKEGIDKKKDLDGVRLEYAAKDSKLEQLRRAPVMMSPEEEREMDRNSDDIRAERQAVSEMRRTAESIKRNSVLGDRDPEFVRYNDFLVRQERMLEERMGLKKEKFLERARERRQIEIDTAKNELDIVRDKESVLTRDKEKIEAEVERLQRVATEIDEYKAKIAQREERLADANKRLGAIDREKQNNNITVIHRAALPRLPSSSSKRMAMILGAGIAGFAAILGLFGLIDYRMKLVSRPEHLQRFLKQPVLGILPIIPAGRRLPNDEDFGEGSRHLRKWLAMQEAINSLRITLTFAPDRPEGGMSSLMITSPREGEGKSTLSAQLAVSLARSGIKTALVEADFHRPTQFQTFEIPRSPGFTDVLAGRLDLADVIQETKFPGLDILTAGEPITDLTSLLVPNRLRPIFDHLKAKYEAVIVDAPPVLPVYDALMLGQQVDQTVVAAMCNHSQFFKINQAIQRLESVGIEIVGVVCSGANTASQYGYYYGYSQATS